MKVIFEKVYPDAVIPFPQNPGDAGWDIAAYVPEGVKQIVPGETARISSGVKAGISKDIYLSVVPRSGLSSKTGLRIANSPGTVDAGFKDEIFVLCHNTGPDIIQITTGMRIAQFIPLPVLQVECVEGLVSDHDNTCEDRRGGEGSSGGMGALA